MRTNSWITCLWGLGLISLACVDDRPIYVDTGTAGTNGASGTTGAAGTSGAAGVTGLAGISGAGGTFGAAGTTGTAGTTGDFGCAEVGAIFEYKNCALAGACHDAKGSAANFSLAGLPFTDIAGWRERLVGKHSKGGGVIASACANSQQYYLVPGSVPATGLFLNKLRANPSCGDHMPIIGDHLTAAELDCVQRWANQLTSNALRPCIDTTCAGQCVGTCGGEWVCDETVTCSAMGRIYCGCDGKTYGGNSCPQVQYAHLGACDGPEDGCPLTCAPGTYCLRTASSPDGGAGSVGLAFSCALLPSGCNGVPSCACLSAGCFDCQERPAYIRCAGI
jgi:hypothetical protein